jgi:broad specificity phosphatase PhoE
MLVGLLRHGETTGGGGFRGRTDDPLSPHGFRQMQRSVARLPAWDAVISSPAKRCLAFARGLHARTPLQIEPRFAELDFGAWEGKTPAALMATPGDAALLARFWQEPDFAPPGGESLCALEARVLEAWQERIGGFKPAAPASQAALRQKARHPKRQGESLLQQGRILVVSHAGVIRVLRCRLAGKPASCWHEFDVPHGSLHLVQLEAPRQ